MKPRAATWRRLRAWPRASRRARRGAYAGLSSGFFTFLILHTQSLDPAWFGPGVPHDLVAWLHGEGPNPFSCATMGEAVSMATTFVVSKLTQPLPKDHIDKLFGTRKGS